MSRSRAGKTAPSPFDELLSLLDGAVGGVFPGYSAIVSIAGEIVFERARGRSCVGTGTGAEIDDRSVFDLASLTKPLAISTLAMHFSDMGLLDLDRPAADILGRPVAAGLGATPRRLLSHASGLPAWRAFHLETSPQAADRRRAILDAALDTPAVAAPGERVTYSDIGFMILTAILEKVGGARLDSLLPRVVPSAGLGYRPLDASGADRRTSPYVATEDDPARGILAGRVNDENAFAMGGISGHAGLFGTASAVHSLVESLVEAWHGRSSWIRPDAVHAFWTKQREPATTTWALGWDTPSRTGSSAGTRPPAGAVGHLGFTGGSIWVDPEREVIAVLLSNRTWPDRSNEAIRTFRPRFYDVVWRLERAR